MTDIAVTISNMTAASYIRQYNILYILFVKPLWFVAENESFTDIFEVVKVSKH